MSNVDPDDGKPPLFPQDIFDAAMADCGVTDPRSLLAPPASPQDLSTVGITALLAPDVLGVVPLLLVVHGGVRWTLAHPTTTDGVYAHRGTSGYGYRLSTGAGVSLCGGEPLETLDDCRLAAWRLGQLPGADFTRPTDELLPWIAERQAAVFAAVYDGRPVPPDLRMRREILDDLDELRACPHPAWPAQR